VHHSQRLVRAIFRWQRQAARRLGWGGELFGGAAVFAQYFGSSLQLTPHLHVRLLSRLDHLRLGAFGRPAAAPAEPPRDEGVMIKLLLELLAENDARLSDGEAWRYLRARNTGRRSRPTHAVKRFGGVHARHTGVAGKAPAVPPP
jgi:hypothetical protein